MPTAYYCNRLSSWLRRYVAAAGDNGLRLPGTAATPPAVSLQFAPYGLRHHETLECRQAGNKAPARHVIAYIDAKIRSSITVLLLQRSKDLLQVFLRERHFL